VANVGPSLKPDGKLSRCSPGLREPLRAWCRNLGGNPEETLTDSSGGGDGRGSAPSVRQRRARGFLGTDLLGRVPCVCRGIHEHELAGMVVNGGLRLRPRRLQRGRTEARTLGRVGGLVGAASRGRGLRCRGSGWRGWGGRGAERRRRVAWRARASHPGGSGGASLHLDPAARRHRRHAGEGAWGWRSPWRRWAADVQGLTDRGRTNRHHRDGRSAGWNHARAALLRRGGGAARAGAGDDVHPLGGRPTCQSMARRRFQASGGDPDPQRRSDHRLSSVGPTPGSPYAQASTVTSPTACA
jgi:hypothetical protein